VLIKVFEACNWGELWFDGIMIGRVQEDMNGSGDNTTAHRESTKER
jgi:hypothetical protein